MAGWETFEDQFTAVALVATLPEGGSSAVLEKTGDAGLNAVIGTSSAAVRAACDGAAGPWSGAEHGHVRIAISAEGDIDISTDGTGNLPSFWCGANDEFTFATHLASLVSLGVPPSLDEVGAVEYLVMLHPLGTRTVLADTSLLPAGGRLRVSPGSAPQLSVERLFVPSNEPMDDAEALREFAAVWSALTSDMLTRTESERVALSLSGGLDSRAIGVECARSGRRPHAFTYGSPETKPARVAAEVADILQLDHTLLALTDERLLPSPSEKALLLDGTHSPAEMYELWFAPALKDLADVVINGKSGGTLWGDEKAMGISDPAQLRDKLERRFAPELGAVTPFLDTGIAAAAPDMIRASLQESLHEWETPARSDMSLFWNVHNRQFRWGNMLTTALRRSGVRLEAPFMDSRFLHFSARLTPQQRLNGRLYLQAHREIFAETADVARSDDGNSPRRMNHIYWSAESTYAHQFAQFARRHPVSAMRRASGRLQGSMAHRLEQNPRLSRLSGGYEIRRSVFAADVWLRSNEAYRSRLLDFLRSSAVPSLLSPDAVERAVGDLSTGAARGGALRLARIATLQSWHQDFVQRATAQKSCR